MPKMTEIVMSNNHHIIQIRGADVSTGRFLQPRITPFTDDRQLKRQCRDSQDADIPLPINFFLRHIHFRVQDIIRKVRFLQSLARRKYRQAHTGMLFVIRFQIFKSSIGRNACHSIAPKIINGKKKSCCQKQQPNSHAHFSLFTHHLFSFWKKFL